jgi:aminoglycoside phosphotransferase (APT) family kinase protein
MEFVTGTSLEPLFDPAGEGATGGEEDPATVSRRMYGAARAMAALHGVDPAAVGLYAEAVVGADEEVQRWSRVLATVDPALAPGWDEVASGLLADLPAAVRPSIVHGDFRLGNLLADGAEVRAIIDWEIWSVGDPRVDLGWFTINADPDTYRRSTPYAGKLPSPAELAAAYGRVADLPWFEALAFFKSSATWSLIVKHNRRRPQPNAELEAMAAVLPHLLDRARLALTR